MEMNGLPAVPSRVPIRAKTKIGVSTVPKLAKLE
jgi:hypothetical protein